jgi:3-hydroxybutyryl-CoA dehydrogenase
MEIKKVGVMGCGIMGAGIVQVVLQASFPVTVGEANEQLLAGGLKRIKGALDKAVEKGTLTPEKRDGAFGRITGTVSPADFADCDLIIEAIVENLEAKTKLFSALDAICPPDTIMASNTSSLPISQIAVTTRRPERFVGLHFFNPATVMSLVEVVKTIGTADKVLETAITFVKALGKVPVLAKDNAGFIVNLLLTAYMLDAIRAVGEGVATVQDIDTAMKLGCNHPMGPLTLADFIGLDTIYSSGNIMFEEYREKRYAPPPLLTRMVTMGHCGRKSGRGFYDYTDPRNPVPCNF